MHSFFPLQHRDEPQTKLDGAFLNCFSNVTVAAALMIVLSRFSNLRDDDKVRIFTGVGTGSDTSELEKKQVQTSQIFFQANIDMNII